MREADGTIIFKEWLPDLPPLNNPGLLEATNARPVDGAYKSFHPLTTVLGSGSTATAAIPGTPIDGIYAHAGGTANFYVAAEISSGASRIYSLESFNFSGAWTANSATLASTVFDFAQFDNLVIAAQTAGSVCLYVTVGSSSGFVTLGSTTGNSPGARAVGVVNRFVVVGTDTSTPIVRWSGINQPTSWPTPASSTAVAQQSGAQTLNALAGPVTAVVGGDQYGLVFQNSALTRMTYVGGSVVFQFDTIDKVNGALFRKGIVHVGGLTYFGNETGFFVTDGVTVKDISKSRVSSHFFSLLFADSGARVSAALDEKNRLIYWSFPTTASPAASTTVLIYNYHEDRWGSATQTTSLLLTGNEFPSGVGVSEELQPYGFMSSQTLGSFTGTPGTAVFTGGEQEPIPGAYSRIQGVKPLVDVTANAVTAAIGTRNNRSDSPTYTSEVTANSRSGFCDFRSEGRYHRPRLTIAGTFNAAQGLEFQVEPSGPV